MFNNGGLTFLLPFAYYFEFYLIPFSFDVVRCDAFKIPKFGGILVDFSNIITILF